MPLFFIVLLLNIIMLHRLLLLLLEGPIVSYYVVSCINDATKKHVSSKRVKRVTQARL